MTPRKRRQRLDSIQAIAVQLRQSDDVAAPDLTSSILDRVDATRPFLDGRTRQMLWVGRIALAVSVATVGLGVALTHRWAPETIEVVSSRPAPLSAVVETVRTEASERLVELRVAVDTVGQQPASSVGPASATGSGGLLALVTSAAPAQAVSSTSKPCMFCGPMIPPAEAARMVPASKSLASVDPGSFDAAAADAVATPRTTWLSARIRLTSAGSGIAGAGGQTPSLTAAGSPTERVGRVVLDELAPLGVGPSADSALAPK